MKRLAVILAIATPLIVVVVADRIFHRALDEAVHAKARQQIEDTEAAAFVGWV